MTSSNTTSKREHYAQALNDCIPGAYHREAHARSSIDLFCSRCERVIEDVHHCASHMPPSKIAKVLRTRGWLISNNPRRHVCPDHKREPDMDHKKPLLHAVSDTALVSMVAANESTATDKAKKAKRLTVEWLGEAFDVDAGHYKDSKDTDASIAKDVGLSEQAVAALREEFFGPLKPPTEVQALMIKLAGLEAGLDTHVASVRQEIKAVTTRIEAMVKANGWKG